jgi:hypothetical protein
MTYSEKRMDKYEELVRKHYQEPVHGKCQNATAATLKEVGEESDEDNEEMKIQQSKF